MVCCGRSSRPSICGSAQPSSAGRFNFTDRLLALAQKKKNLIFARAGILFWPAGTVTVPDPITPAAGSPLPGTGCVFPGFGMPGDVLSPSTPDLHCRAAGGLPAFRVKADLEDDLVRRACEGAMAASERGEMIVEIPIRRYVSPEPGGPFSGLLGATMMPSPSTVVVDDLARGGGLAWNFFGRPESFTRTLAHENGHALGLIPRFPLLSLFGPEDPCAPEVLGPLHAGHLMQQTRCATTGFGFDKLEIAFAQAGARAYSSAVTINRQNQIAPRKKRMRRSAPDQLFDVGPAVVHPHRVSSGQPQHLLPGRKPWLDILDVAAVLEPGGSMFLDIRVSDPMADSLSNLSYGFMLDLDNNSTSGGSPAVGFAHSFRGIELSAIVQAGKTRRCLVGLGDRASLRGSAVCRGTRLKSGSHGNSRAESSGSIQGVYRA